MIQVQQVGKADFGDGSSSSDLFKVVLEVVGYAFP